METLISIKPLLAVLVALIGSVFIVVAGRKPNLREAVTFITGFIVLGLVGSMLKPVLSGQVIEYNLVQILPNVGFLFRVDAFGLLFAMVASILWIVTSLYSIGYMRAHHEPSQTRFYSFFAIAIASAIGVAFSGNLLTLYLFYEVLSLSTYPLVTHNQNPESKRAGRKYLTYLMGGSIGLFLPALILVYYYTGTLDFAAGGILSGHVTMGMLTVMFFLFLFGIGKAAVMPVHSWLPSAMVAPTPVSSLLHAVAVVKVGVFSTLRVFLWIYGPETMRWAHLDTLILIFASVTIIVASLFAMRQDNLKARLAYSTVGQLSYIILACGLLVLSGVKGGMLHIAMHAFGKITLFFCAGAILVHTGYTNVSQMRGLGWRMPVTMTAFFIGSLSVIGLPPMGGFLSKWYLALGSIESGHTWVMIVILTSSILNAAYFLPITYNAFFVKPVDDVVVDEAPIWTVLPPVFTALVSFWLFLNPSFFLSLAQMAAKAVLGG